MAHYFLKMDRTVAVNGWESWTQKEVKSSSSRVSLVDEAVSLATAACSRCHKLLLNVRVSHGERSSSLPLKRCGVDSMRARAHINFSLGEGTLIGGSYMMIMFHRVHLFSFAFLYGLETGAIRMGWPGQSYFRRAANEQQGLPVATLFFFLLFSTTQSRPPHEFFLISFFFQTRVQKEFQHFFFPKKNVSFSCLVLWKLCLADSCAPWSHISYGRNHLALGQAN